MKHPSPFASEFKLQEIFKINDFQMEKQKTSSAMPICASGRFSKFCQLQDEGQSLMRSAMSQLQLSARAYHRILKLSRTIADLAGSEEIQSTHLGEALQYRPKFDDRVTKGIR